MKSTCCPLSDAVSSILQLPAQQLVFQQLLRLQQQQQQLLRLQRPRLPPPALAPGHLVLLPLQQCLQSTTKVFVSLVLSFEVKVELRLHKAIGLGFSHRGLFLVDLFTLCHINAINSKATTMKVKPESKS